MFGCECFYVGWVVCWIGFVVVGYDSEYGYFFFFRGLGIGCKVVCNCFYIRVMIVDEGD